MRFCDDCRKVTPHEAYKFTEFPGIYVLHCTQCDKYNKYRDVPKGLRLTENI